MWVRIILISTALVMTCVYAAGDCCEDDVWICQGVYEINMSERAVIGDYTIKLREISNNSAMLVLYKNKQFIDRYFMSEGDIETYFDRFRINLIRIENESVTAKTYMYGKEKLWAKEDAFNLSVGENCSTGDYLISIIDFTDRSVNLSIQKGDIHLASDRFNVEDSRIYDGLLKVCVSSLQDNYSIIETYRPLTPDLVINISVHDIYQPDQVIECGITIQNDFVPVRDVLLDVQVSIKPDTTSNAVFNETFWGSFSMWYQAIYSTDICNMTIYPPVLPYPSNISIVASVTGYIWNGDGYSVNCNRETQITPYIIARKSVTPDELTLPESATVNITILNLRDDGTDIELTDIVPDGFVIETDTGTAPPDRWTFRLGPHSFRNFTYHLAAREVGTFEVPACTAVYDGYAVSSLPGSITVHGSVITAEKMLLATLDEHTRQVVIRIENGGDHAADIEVVDEIPAGIIVIGGNTAGKARILPKESYNHSYIIQFEDMDSLPPAVVRFVDDYGNTGSVQSNPVGSMKDAERLGSVGGAERTSAPAQTQSEVISRGELAMLLIHIFILFACIFLIPIVAGYLMLRNAG
ncbi:MAG TPA: hypothetical protein EYP67_06740 [Methanosarcinales archaeon]|nr:hypothetical protein [Methanosarcinales archaeon]